MALISFTRRLIGIFPLSNVDWCRELHFKSTSN
jgi:hypothetical protein